MASPKRSLLLQLPLLSFIILLLLLAARIPAAAGEEWAVSNLKAQPIGRLPSPKTPEVTYHNGSILVGNNNTISVHVIFYGDFTKLQRSTLRAFLRSFGCGAASSHPAPPPPPSRRRQRPNKRRAPPPPPPSKNRQPTPPPPPPPSKPRQPPPPPPPPPSKPRQPPPPPRRKPLALKAPSNPTVARWWAITRSYSNKQKQAVARGVKRGKEIRDRKYSMGKNLTLTQIELLIVRSLGYFPTDPQGIYLLLISQDVRVKGLCRQFCGQHFFVAPQKATNNKALPYAWVSNTVKRCPTTCSWPFGSSRKMGTEGTGAGVKSKPAKGLIPPNGDVGIDGMIFNIAELLSGVATNPQLTGYYYQAKGAGAVEEPVGFCKDTSELPTDLLKNKTTGASFNVYGYRNRQFLLPWMWDPSTKTCAIQAE